MNGYIKFYLAEGMELDLKGIKWKAEIGKGK